MKLFIANIPYKLEEAELKQILVQYGQVASIKLVTDPQTGKREGFGFIEMPVQDQAQKAISGLNDKEIYGRKLALSEATENDQGKLQKQKSNTQTHNSNNNNTGEIDGNHC